MQICFLIKRKIENWQIGKYMAKVTILWHDNFCENQTPLQRNGMAAIPKTYEKSTPGTMLI